MSVLTLRALALDDQASFRRAFVSFRASDPRWAFAFRFDPDEPFAIYVARVEAWTRGEDLAGWVPMTYLVGVVDGEVVGRVSIRHVLTDSLRRVGGHIGYDVVREHRRRGHASEMLAQAIPRARALGIEDILLTTDDDNVASIRTIERNDGELCDRIDVDGIQKRRYVILPPSGTMIRRCHACGIRCRIVEHGTHAPSDLMLGWHWPDPPPASDGTAIVPAYVCASCSR